MAVERENAGTLGDLYLYAKQPHPHPYQGPPFVRSVRSGTLYGPYMRNQRLEIRLSEDELAEIKRRAGGQPAGTWIREQCLGTPAGESAGTPIREAPDAFDRRVTQLKAQGLTTPVATQLAREELDF